MFYFYSHTKPDAKIIINRGAAGHEVDVTGAVISFNTSNDINSMFGNFMVVLDNTNDRFVDRYGNTSIPKMSSIEIFVLDNGALNAAPRLVNSSNYFVKESDTLENIIDNLYGLNQFFTDKGTTKDDFYGGLSPEQYRAYYREQIVKYNPTLFGDKNNKIDYNKKIEQGSRLNLPPMIVAYKKIFLGVVETVTQNFTAGNPMTITITGESIGYWLRASTVNIHPSFADTIVSNSSDPTYYANNYSQMNAIDIMKDLIRGSTNNVITVSDFSFDTTNESFESNLPNQEQEVTTNYLNEANVTINGEVITIGGLAKGLGEELPNTLTDSINILDKCSDKVYLGFNLEGIQNKNTGDIDIQGLTSDEDVNIWWQASKEYILESNILDNLKIQRKNTNDVIQQDQLDNQIQAVQEALNKAKGDIESNSAAKGQFDAIKALREKIQNKLRDKLSSSSVSVLQSGLMEHWVSIFNKMVLEVANVAYLTEVYPMKWALKSPTIMDGDYQPKSNIAKTIADNLYFEFYMDTNGHFIFKPPLYNIGIPNNDLTYVIEEEDLQGFSLTDTVDGIITRCGVVGDTFMPVNLPRLQMYSLHSDLNLIRKYGVHHQDLQNVLFISNVSEGQRFAASYMDKNNQELVNASVTIMGRPDIRLGVAVYFKPRDMVFYIKAISHDFSVGQGYTTTLTLIGGRRIITGVQVESKVVTITRKKIMATKKDTNKKSVQTVSLIEDKNNKDNPHGDKIQHWLQVTNANVFDISEMSAEIVGNDGKISVAGDKDFLKTIKERVMVVRDSYLITNHPNDGFVGLIVSRDSSLISSINAGMFNTIERAISDGLGGIAGNYSNQIINYDKSQNVVAVFEIIKSFWEPFKNAKPMPGLSSSLTVDKVTSENFTKDKLDAFVLNFLNSVQKAVQSPDLDSQQAKNYFIAAKVISDISQDIEDAGSYRQYTDLDGRELPATFDYGKQLIIQTLSTNPKLDTAPSSVTSGTTGSNNPGSNNSQAFNSSIDKMVADINGILGQSNKVSNGRLDNDITGLEGI